ncbi:60S ribosome subunit biogenesis protein NIP7 [Nosema bombycis CQ1]|uniref:60S ribosome subunit biogenesis protein NIP7 n=1 Tax=Nosema bombycis (strain CQ1 / CVCC 102059) TaxID=578461 RepID=R0KL38_NOSB1|nr:60S ribosome subunit biogenesis protein NIP7 [Nosema bombycis CQ1]|eukprot:EOB11336.1 60S ribosome subunit biogenesis protein NIP7 [Nosema bombycis CQ1]
MRDLRADEENKVMNKLKFFIGDNIKEIVNKDRNLYLHKRRVLLINKNVAKAVSPIGIKSLVFAGTIIGKFTKNDNFKLKISSLNLLSPFAIYKVWIKKSAEMNYLYGNNALKSHIHRITDSIPLNSGVFVYSQNDIPLGFGVTSHKPEAFQGLKGYNIVVIRQGDNGEYVRGEHKIT